MEPSRGFLNQEFYTMPGLGALYSRVSIYAFGDWNKCGEVMGLAPYGRPERIKPLLELNGNGQLAAREWSDEFNRPWLSDSGENWETSPSMQHWQDLAWRVQGDTEKVLLARARWLRETTGAKNLCMAGGVALNCVANGRIAREAGFDYVWIQPAAGDDGIAIGCAYYGHMVIQKKTRSFVMKSAYLGVDYSEKHTHELINRRLVRLVTKTTSSKNIFADTARLLSEGQIVGWFQGRSEFGPRALGNRSILADPREPKMKDHLNQRVKHRQSFRPFAPIVLAERAAEIFDSDQESPFMMLAAAVRPHWRERIPAIVHIDGTARLQTVRQEDNPILHALLKEFECLTSVPVLLNTSFNVKGEPIVETPGNALSCFLGTGVDCLVLHDLLITKNSLHRILPPMMQVYSAVGAIVPGLGQQPGHYRLGSAHNRQ
jgi:carbamoyltransferase